MERTDEPLWVLTGGGTIEECVVFTEGDLCLFVPLSGAPQITGHVSQAYPTLAAAYRGVAARLRMRVAYYEQTADALDAAQGEVSDA